MERVLTHMPFGVIKAAFVELCAMSRDCMAYRAKVFIWLFAVKKSSLTFELNSSFIGNEK